MRTNRLGTCTSKLSGKSDLAVSIHALAALLSLWSKWDLYRPTTQSQSSFTTGISGSPLKQPRQSTFAQYAYYMVIADSACSRRTRATRVRSCWISTSCEDVSLTFIRCASNSSYSLGPGFVENALTLPNSIVPRPFEGRRRDWGRGYSGCWTIDSASAFLPSKGTRLHPEVPIIFETCDFSCDIGQRNVLLDVLRHNIALAQLCNVHCIKDTDPGTDRQGGWQDRQCIFWFSFV